jgi:hypothetical protein
MIFTISFSKEYYNENEDNIKKYFEQQFGDKYQKKTFSILENEILIQVTVSSAELILQILNHYMFDTPIHALGSLIITLPEEYYREMINWGYLQKAIINGYKIFREIENNLVYLILDLSQFKDFEKVIELIEYYYNNNDDDEDEKEKVDPLMSSSIVDMVDSESSDEEEEDI